MFYFLIGFIEYFKNLLFQFMYLIGLRIVDIYLSIKDYNTKNKEDGFKYVASYYHDNKEIKEYEINFQNTVHKLKFVKNDFNKFLEKEDVVDVLEKRNKILHCCLVNKEGNLVFDCTEEIRSFRYYIENAESTLTWRLFLEHIISFKQQSIDFEDSILLICKNDNDLSEVSVVLDNQNLDNFIQI